MGYAGDKNQLSRALQTQRFKISKVVFVADRGAMKSEQIADLKAVKKATLYHVTALTKPQILKLIENGVLQLGLFDQDVHEVEHDGKRLIMVRRNPIRAQEAAASRQERITALVTKAQVYADKLMLKPSFSTPQRECPSSTTGVAFARCGDNVVIHNQVVVSISMLGSRASSSIGNNPSCLT
jgi:hypothetical protein